MTSGLVCTQPFGWCEVHGDGSVFLCCPAWLKAPAGNLLRQSLDEIWNGPLAREVRKGVLNGSFHRCGRRCPRLAANFPPVMLPDQVEDAELREALGAGRAFLSYGPKTLNLCFDHRCNLACRSCRPRGNAPDVSSTLVEQLTMKILADLAPHVETLVIAGHGDPFAAPAYLAILRGYTPVSWPRLKNIHLHSNGLLWEQTVWQSIAVAHPLIQEAEISVDAACAGTYGLNRGGDWLRLLDNLSFIATLPLKGKLSCVVQRNNFREMPAFVALARSLGFSAYFSQLVNWGTFSRREYHERAVHLSEHPDHLEFLEILTQIATLDGVDLGNLTPLANTNLL